MVEETINNRIQTIINQHYNGNVTEFCRATNISQATMNDIVKGRKNKPSFQTIAKILTVNTLNINPIGLLIGEEPLFNSVEKSNCPELEELKQELIELGKKYTKSLENYCTKQEEVERLTALVGSLGIDIKNQDPLRGHG